MGKNIVQKGKEGETIVSQEITKLNLGQGILINNAIFKFPSILSKDGTLTTQIDHLIIVEKIVICIETKYYEHLVEHDFSKMEWKTDYNEDVENPIWQNHKHKEILCNIFNVRMKNIITIEVVIGSDINGYMATKKYPNDYICDEKNIYYLLELLLKSDYEKTFDFDNLKRRILSQCLTYGVDDIALKVIEDEHIKRLKLANRINVWMKRRNRPMYHFCDVAYCQKCGKLLAFRKFNSLKKGKQRSSIDFLVGCTGYNTFSQDGCQSDPIYDFEKLEIKNFLVVEEEKQNMTMVELIKEKEVLERSVATSKRKMEMLQNEVAALEEEKNALTNLIRVLETENEELNRERKNYKKLLGKIYIKK